MRHCKKLTPPPLALSEGAVHLGRGEAYRHICPPGRGHDLYLVHGPRRWHLFCSRGCWEADILRAFGLAPNELSARAAPESKIRYQYLAPDGSRLFEVARRVNAERKRDRFYVVGPRLPGVVYRLAEMLAAPAEAPVFWVEGERDVETLRARGLVAVTTSLGAYSYDPAVAAHFAGRTVIIIPDADEPGRRYAEAVLASLAPIAKAVRTVSLGGQHKDVSEWLRGRTRDPRTDTVTANTIERLWELAGLPAALLPVQKPPPAPTQDSVAPLGRLEAGILLAMGRARNHMVTVDALPMLVAGCEEAWNARAREPIVRYPHAPRQELAKARAGLSRALKTLIAKGWVARQGRRIEPRRAGWLDAARMATAG